MTTQMQKYKKELCFLGRCSKTQRNRYLNTAPSTLVNAVINSEKSFLEGNLSISNYYRKILRKDINIFKKLATRGVPIATKKKILRSQKGEALLPIKFNVLKNLF